MARYDRDYYRILGVHLQATESPIRGRAQSVLEGETAEDPGGPPC
jgi:hypothetical protein